MIECIQKPGDTIFVPAGWWHCVLNIGFTIAITHNLLLLPTLPCQWSSFVSQYGCFTNYLKENFASVISDVVEKEKKCKNFLATNETLKY
jgi:histone arginine demethylase JMJD6